jgi:outer membrane protein TolC
VNKNEELMMQHRSFITLFRFWTCRVILALGCAAHHASAQEDNAFPNPLTLAAAQKFALAANPGIQVAAARVGAASAVYRQARSAFFPSLTFTGEATHVHDIPQFQAFLAAEPYESYTIALNLNWLIFDGFSREFAVLAAEADERASQAARADVERLLLQAVAAAFNQSLFARENVRISKEDAAFNQELARETEIRFKAGTASRSELLNFRIRSAEAEQRLLHYQEAQATARLALAELMGVPQAKLGNDTKLAFTEGHILDKSVPELASELAYALQNRPDIEQLRETVAGRQAEVRGARGDFLPELALQASYGEARWNDIKFNDSVDASSFLGVTLSWDLFAGGRTVAGVQLAESNLLAARMELSGAELQIAAEVRERHQQLRSVLAQLKLQQQIHAMTAETKELVVKEYRAGKASLTRLNEAQTDLVRAAANLALARVRVVETRENLDAATGRIIRRVD